MNPSKKNHKKTLYLANPYGFSEQMKSGPLKEIIKTLESLGAEVWEPFERNNQINKGISGWAYKIARADISDVQNADGIFAIVNGTPPDEGVMIELGLSMAWNKAIFLFRDDFRTCTDSEDYPLNLMIFAGLPNETWQKYWYTSLDQLKDPHKALVQWLQKE